MNKNMKASKKQQIQHIHKFKVTVKTSRSFIHSRIVGQSTGTNDSSCFAGNFHIVTRNMWKYVHTNKHC